MKALKCLVAAAAAVLSAGLASAQTIVHITGSTAFRKAAHQAIGNILNSGYTVGYSGTDLTKASQAVFTGTTKVGNISVVIKTSWSGSVGGLQSLAQQSPVLTTTTWLQNGLSGPSLTGPYDAAAPADVTMSDSFQSSTAFNGTGYNTLHDTIVGVVPFVWTKGSSNDATVSASLANVTNVTPLLAKALLSAGVPMSMLTGNTADSSIDVLPVGRDEDSGTRLDAFAESGFGIFSSPLQYNPTITGSTITALVPYPANTVNGISYPVGHSGFNSGGTLATTLNTPVDAAAKDSFGNKFALIGYFGTSDAASVNGGNNNLTYNGVAYSVQNVQEGKYTFWSYEHLMYQTTLSGNTKTVADQIANQILTTDASAAGIVVSTMNVSRAVEGGVISHN